MPSTLMSPLTLAELQALVNGLPRYCPTAIFTVAGQTFTSPQAVTFIQSVLAAVSAVATAKTGWTDARLAEAKIVSQDGAAVKAIRDNVALMFSNNTTTLADFMIAPKKPRVPLSVEARAAATAKARATRLARGTESKKKKATVTGNVTGVTITPATNPAPAPASPTPAVTPPAPGGSAPAQVPTTAPLTPVTPVLGGVVAPVAASGTHP
jgi:hypothetical protein